MLVGQVEEIQEADVVVAAKGHGARVARLRPHDQVDHAARIGPPVAIVAEMDDPPVGGLVALDLGRDAPVHLAEQVAAAMHVADGVDAQAFLAARVAVVHQFGH